MTAGVILLVVFAGLGVGAFLRLLRRKNVDIIARARLTRRPERPEGTVHVFVCVADHYEPYWHNSDPHLARERVHRWLDHYPRAVDSIRDAGGGAPRHAFFYPQEEYDPACLDMLAELHRAGFGEVEVQLHHDGDTSAGLRRKLVAFTETLRREHGLLHTDPVTGRPVYAFVHGNWTLDNSAPDGSRCGVNDELRVLAETGCYADFTYPSAPHPTQPPVINSIYYATEDDLPRSHWRGVEAAYGRSGSGDLLLVAGPLTIDWRRRRRGILPAVENGDITGINPATPERVDAWIRAAIHVRGWPRWIFVKAYTHGTQEQNAEILLSDRAGGLVAMYRDLLVRYNDGERHVIHFSTPWEIVRCVRVLESADESSIRAIERFESRP